MLTFEFQHAHYLGFLILLPIVLVGHFYLLHRIRRKGITFANFRALKRITGKRLVTRNYTMLILRLLLLAALILAMAGPIVWYETETTTSDFVIAIDTSASMMGQDIEPTRLAVAKEDAKLFVDTLLPGTRAGVISFAGVSLIRAPLTDDFTKVRDAIDRIEVLDTSGTDIPSALITSANMMLDTERGRSIILVTDGSSTIEVYRDKSLNQALSYLDEHRVKAHAIGIGSESGPVGFLPSFYNVSANYDETTLQYLANETGGVYVHATSTEEALDAFQTIVEETQTQLLKKELQAYVMLAALILLMLEWVLSNTRFRPLP